ALGLVSDRTMSLASVLVSLLSSARQHVSRLLYIVCFSCMSVLVTPVLAPSLPAAHLSLTVFLAAPSLLPVSISSRIQPVFLGDAT
uniref:hypothetical protein n=1 Tax=Salmonella enterica TaxID=28901 RepID=UPI00398C2C9B